MLKILFFAQTRELVGVAELTLPAQFPTAEDLRQHLASQGGKWALALESSKLLVAINQQISALSDALHSGDEIAFFPPVTGG
ncbi:molybdopterin synthase sulfur carrier subunit [Pasteurellaceae bacterium Macca]|nr:molybdopterin synthase sulfur carrier subunit [Pasteurellaceae bacterium Macca]